MSSTLERHRITHLAGLALPLRNKVRAILLAVDGTRCLAAMPTAPLSNLVCVVSWSDHDDAFNVSDADAYAQLREEIHFTMAITTQTWIIVPRLAHYASKRPSRAAIDGPSPLAFAAKRDAFHAHLDRCQQCREHPMALCEDGALLLQDAAVNS